MGVSKKLQFSSKDQDILRYWKHYSIHYNHPIKVGTAAIKLLVITYLTPGQGFKNVSIAIISNDSKKMEPPRVPLITR